MKRRVLILMVISAAAIFVAAAKSESDTVTLVDLPRGSCVELESGDEFQVVEASKYLLKTVSATGTPYSMTTGDLEGAKKIECNQFLKQYEERK